MATLPPRAWAEQGPTGVRRFVPILGWLPAYDRSLLRFDVIAGVTVWGLLVPEMIAYAGLAGLPPQAGLYTLLATLAAYAIFGTSRHLVVAGTSAAAVLLASTVGDLAVGHADYLANAAALVLLVGGLFLLAGVCRLGFIAQFLSRPVVEGFVFGLAIFVTVKQLPKLFGIEGGTSATRAARRSRSESPRSGSCSAWSGSRRRSREAWSRSCSASWSAGPSICRVTAST